MEANVMADYPAKVAEHLHKFIQAAEKKERANAAVQTKFPRSPPAEHPPDRILKIYEVCLSKLGSDDLAKLDEIIEKMSGAV
jgi:hypothetical protein